MDAYIRRTYEPLKFLGLGRPFWVPLRTTKGAPLISLAPTWEETGERFSVTLVVRAPLTQFAIGVGYWRDVDPDSVVKIHTEDAEYDTYCAVNGPVPRDQWNAARLKIAGMGLDPDEEMELMQKMGVFG